MCNKLHLRLSSALLHKSGQNPIAQNSHDHRCALGECAGHNHGEQPRLNCTNMLYSPQPNSGATLTVMDTADSVTCACTLNRTQTHGRLPHFSKAPDHVVYGQRLSRVTVTSQWLSLSCHITQAFVMVSCYFSPCAANTQFCMEDFNVCYKCHSFIHTDADLVLR